MFALRLKLESMTAKGEVVYIPDRLRNTYLWQDRNLRIARVENLSALRTRRKRFFSSREGRKFLGYRIKKITAIHGVSVWMVNGPKLRDGLKSGDVDFTMGGHGYRYLYVPEDEIWIDQANARRGDLEPVIWHEYLERSLMRKGMNYDRAHTLASDLEIAIRAKKHFILPVGTFRQTAGFCGPAALKIVLDYLQLDLSEKELARLCQTTSKKGTDPNKMVTAARTLGLRAFQKEGMTVGEVKRYIKSGTPVIANFQLKPPKGEGHYAVLIGYSRNTFVLSDPQENQGYREVKIGDFMRMWYELEDRTVRQGIVIRTRQP